MGNKRFLRAMTIHSITHMLVIFLFCYVSASTDKKPTDPYSEMQAQKGTFVQGVTTNNQNERSEKVGENPNSATEGENEDEIMDLCPDESDIDNAVNMYKKAQSEGEVQKTEYESLGHLVQNVNSTLCITPRHVVFDLVSPKPVAAAKDCNVELKAVGDCSNRDIRSELEAKKESDACEKALGGMPNEGGKMTEESKQNNENSEMNDNQSIKGPENDDETKESLVYNDNKNGTGKQLTEEEMNDIEDVKEEQVKMKEQKIMHKPKEFVTYESLTDEKKEQLAVFCCTKILKNKNASIIDAALGWFKNNAKPKEDINKNGDEKITQAFIKCQELIANSASKNESVFSQDIVQEKVIVWCNEMAADNPINLYKMTIHELISTYKCYIRDYMNGLIPCCIAKQLMVLAEMGVFDTIDNKKYQELIKYLPFVMTEKKKKILQEIFRIFESVVDNYKDTKMNMKGLITCIAPSLFPKESLGSPKHFKAIQKIVNVMQLLDYDKIDISVYKKFIAYHKKRQIAEQK